MCVCASYLSESEAVKVGLRKLYRLPREVLIRHPLYRTGGRTRSIEILLEKRAGDSYRKGCVDVLVLSHKSC